MSADPTLGSPEAATTSLDRGLALLRVIAESGPARADELAATAGLPLSTTYRYIRTLQSHGFISGSAGLFGPGPVLDSSSPARVGRRELVRLATPVLERLVDLSGETAVLVVRVGVHAVCIHQVESPHAIRMAFRIGQALPLYAGAGQRMLLAHAPPDVIESVLGSEFERFTPNTPTRANLARRLESTRLTGVATSRGEYSAGSVAIAAPVFFHQHLVCSLTVAGPHTRCGPRWQAHTKPIVQSQSGALAAELESTLDREAP